MTSSYPSTYSIPKSLPSIDEADRHAVMDILAVTPEEKDACIAEFEEGIRYYCNAPFAVFFSSLQSALYAAAAAIDISASDRLLLPANTPISFASPFLHIGARPTLVDIDPATGLMDLEALEKIINIPSSRGKTLVLPCHFAGIPLDLVHLESLITQPNTLILENASHALGSISSLGDRIGSCSHSDLAIISLESGCTLSTEQGSLLFTSQHSIYQRLLQHKESSKPTSMQAALGLSQLRKLDIYAQKRSALAALYQKHLSLCPHISTITSNQPASWAPGFLQVQCDFKKLSITREHLLENLQQQGIQATLPPPTACEKIPHPRSSTPHAQAQAEHAIELPFYPDMDEENVKKVCKALQKSQA